MNCYPSLEAVSHRMALENRKQRSYDRNMAAVIKNRKGAGIAIESRDETEYR